MKTLPLWLSLTLGFFDNFHDRDKGVCVKQRRSCTESKNHSLSCSIIWWNWRSPPSLMLTETPWFGSQTLFCLWPDVSVEQRQLFEQMFKQRASGGRRSYCWKHSEDQVASAAITEVRERIKKYMTENLSKGELYQILWELLSPKDVICRMPVSNLPTEFLWLGLE